MTSVPRGRALSRNLVVNIVGLTIPLVTSFVTVPIYIHTIGAARYGVVALTWILLGYLGALDFGLSSASADALDKQVHAQIAEQDPGQSDYAVARRPDRVNVNRDRDERRDQRDRQAYDIHHEVARKSAAPRHAGHHASFN